MPHIARPTRPLADVNVIPQKDGRIEVVACFMPQAPLGERAEAVLAIDGSFSMRKMFGRKDPFFNEPNYVEAVARKVGDILTGYTGSGQVSMSFWAVGPGGSQVQPIGTFDAAGCAAAEIPAPKNMGGDTQLLPVLKHICEKVSPKAEGMTFGVIITDGIFRDLDDAKKYCMQIGQEYVAGKRKQLKLVLIGVGDQVDEDQMLVLDDMFEGTPMEDDVDIWAHGLAASMKDEMDILGVLFGELVDPEEIIAASGTIVDDQGCPVTDEKGRELNTRDGIKAKLRFFLSKGAKSFTIHVPQGDIVQDITGV